MFKTIFSLALEGIRRKKSQTLLIAAVLIISLAFAVMTISYSESIVATNSNYRFSTYGSWYGGFANADSDDTRYLESTDWLESYGLTTCYGTAGNTGIGTIDNNFASFGVSMNSGHLPENSGEIAIEADTLSSLGYGYTLGQDITLTVLLSAGDETVFVSRTYTLCGVISEYSDTWSSASTLNGAIITEEDADDIYNTALKMASAYEYELDMPVTSCYFSVKSGLTSTAQSELNYYLFTVSKGTITVNSAYLDNASDSTVNTVYVVMIFAVSLLAVVIVYILQMQSEIRKIVRLRSLGSTKGQALLLVILETLIVSVPSIIIGMASGAVGLWALLRFSVYAGSVDVIVSIPMSVLTGMFVMWIVGILVVRLVTVQVALFTPLTGRMGMQVKKARNSRRLQKTAIIVLSAVFCTVVIYTVLTALPTVVAYQLRVAAPSYFISTSEFSISDEELDEIAEIPGISDAWGFSRIYADVTIGDIERSNAVFYVVDETDGWNGAFDFSKVDLEAFHNGDCVMIIIPSTDTASAVPTSGESMTVTVSGVDVDTTIGAVNNFKVLNGSGYNYGFMISTYDVVCSKAFLQKLIDALPGGGSVSYYGDVFESGDTAVFKNAYAFADSNASYLSTDTAISSYVIARGWGISNYREKYSAQLQSFSQTLILLFVAGAAIGVVTLIILSSTIRLETEREKKRYGVLQAIGMSKRQRNLRLAGTALLRSLVAFAIGWAVFILRLIVSCWSSIKAGATVWNVIKSYMDNIILLSFPATIVFVNLAAFAVVFLICYTSKLGLNKYTLMEMLREDR
ncbi:MAG: ABC transporter permease [Oscillospiraceae bacterium]|nr:ABC transporter permease [Oscillospiraceae bacterium]